MGTKRIKGSRSYNYWPSSQFLSLKVKVTFVVLRYSVIGKYNKLQSGGCNDLEAVICKQFCWYGDAKCYSLSPVIKVTWINLFWNIED
jgi:hypothetical protein